MEIAEIPLINLLERRPLAASEYSPMKSLLIANELIRLYMKQYDEGIHSNISMLRKAAKVFNKLHEICSAHSSGECKDHIGTCDQMTWALSQAMKLAMLAYQYSAFPELVNCLRLAVDIIEFFNQDTKIVSPTPKCDIVSVTVQLVL